MDLRGTGSERSSFLFTTVPLDLFRCVNVFETRKTCRSTKRTWWWVSGTPGTRFCSSPNSRSGSSGRLLVVTRTRWVKGKTLTQEVTFYFIPKTGIIRTTRT